MVKQSLIGIILLSVLTPSLTVFAGELGIAEMIRQADALKRRREERQDRIIARAHAMLPPDNSEPDPYQEVAESEPVVRHRHKRSVRFAKAKHGKRYERAVARAKKRNRRLHASR